MTTLPPEPNDGDSAAQQPGLPVPPPAAPVPPAAPTPPPAAPAAPVPPQPQYQQPQYQQPQQPGYQQPQYAAADPAAQAASMVTLNYWLSVFFTWLPALIFYFVEKGKNPLADQYHRENLNFSLVRMIPIVATWVLAFIPYLGAILAILLWIVSAVLFVFHIIAAVKATENFKQGIPPQFIFNIPFIK